MEDRQDDRDASSGSRQFGESFGKNFEKNEAEKRFDASQYAFFGRDVTHEVEIGGLEEEDYIEHLHVPDDEEEAFCVVERGELHRSTSRVDGKTELSESREGGRKPIIEAFIGLSPAFKPSCVNSSDHRQDAPAEQGRNEWFHHLHPKAVHALDAERSLEPTSLQTHEKQRCASDLSSVPTLRPPVTLCMPQRTQQTASTVQNQGIQVQSDQASSGLLPNQFRIPYLNIQSPAEVLSSIPSYGCSFHSQCSSSDELKSYLAPAELQSTPSTAHLGCLAIPGPQQLPSSSSLLPPQVVLQCHIPHLSRFHAVPGSPYSPYNPQPNCHSRPLVPQLQGRRGHDTASEESREVLPVRGKQALRQSLHRVADEDVSLRNSHLNGWQTLRSKYMTIEEIENIVKIQWAATHSSDPYVDDYYHQAVQTKSAAGPFLGVPHFAPSHLRDLPSHTRAAVEPHAYLQVDALGRVPFSSIHRPRPLLEVNSGIGSGVPSDSNRQSDGIVAPLGKPLEQEPMLAARIAVEDGFCLLLDVDDIDRLLVGTQYPDGGAQLRRRRQLLVETVAASLQLVDPEDESARVYGAKEKLTLPIKEDILLLRLVTLSKGRKFITRYLQLLPPGSELVQIVTVALLQHLRFLFGGAPTDTNTFVTIYNLANTVAASVMSLDLPALSACLAAVLLAPEQPPLRPMGCPGDGATIILKAVLERATHLLTDPSAGYSLQSRAVWQASFDAFFSLLIKYCTNKYDSIFHSLMMITPGNPGAVKAAAALSMNKELPVEILRASLPHTSDHQRHFLLEFTKQSTAVSTVAP